jgi:hypothetical protein
VTGLVTIAVAGDIAEAQEVRGVLDRAGITATLEGAEGAIGGAPGDGPCRILVEAPLVDRARDALSDADEDDAV